MVPAKGSPTTTTGTSTATFSRLLHDQQVDVLDDLAHRVLLDVLDEGQVVLAVGGELEQRVRAADQQGDLVTRQGEVHGLGAVAVQDGGDLTGGAQATGEALAELRAHLSGDLVVFRHDDSPCGPTGPRSGMVRLERERVRKP
ncbi:hypothetical protein QE374_002945 [Microbacterium sp. SORGH_AS428]|nr:hypothetical protein [Microbacterium sp. SORGH_AS_0428]